MSPTIADLRQSLVIIKPRPGNRSAQLVRSVFKPRVNRKLPTAIGSVSVGANLTTGDGIRMRSPYRLDDLTREDRARIETWLASAGSTDALSKPTLASVAAQLDQVLTRIDGALGAQLPAVAEHASDVESAVLGTAWHNLEATFDSALQDLAALVQHYAEMGVVVTSLISQSEQTDSRNPLDQLQGRANYLMTNVLPRLPRMCQELGLKKRGGSVDGPPPLKGERASRTRAAQAGAHPDGTADLKFLYLKGAVLD